MTFFSFFLEQKKTTTHSPARTAPTVTRCRGEGGKGREEPCRWCCCLGRGKAASERGEEEEDNDSSSLSLSLLLVVLLRICPGRETSVQRPLGSSPPSLSSSLPKHRGAASAEARPTSSRSSWFGAGTEKNVFLHKGHLALGGDDDEGEEDAATLSRRRRERQETHPLWPQGSVAGPPP